METATALQEFIQALHTSISEGKFIKLTLSKPSTRSADLKNIYLRLVEIKGQIMLGFTLRHSTKDITKNYTISEGVNLVENHIGNDFLNADLFTTKADLQIRFNKKRKARLLRLNPSQQSLPSTRHDAEKDRLIDPANNIYLKELGICNQQGKVLKSGQRKFRQINKYIEIIDSLLRQHRLTAEPHIVDMGSGKGYLTFALYDYLSSQLGLSPKITGIELRKNLVDLCNDLARKCSFEGLHFEAKDILDYDVGRLDMLIALHACDTATDIALAKGIRANAAIIVVAPCCHKQIRKQMHCKSDLQAILHHGILEERQAELITDGIRALLLEARGYNTKVFEFISTEHTSKNLMITAVKAKKKPEALQQVEAIKAQFGIEYHYLEKLLEES